MVCDAAPLWENLADRHRPGSWTSERKHQARESLRFLRPELLANHGAHPPFGSGNQFDSQTSPPDWCVTSAAAYPHTPPLERVHEVAALAGWDMWIQPRRRDSCTELLPDRRAVKHSGAATMSNSNGERLGRIETRLDRHPRLRRQGGSSAIFWQRLKTQPRLSHRRNWVPLRFDDKASLLWRDC